MIKNKNDIGEITWQIGAYIEDLKVNYAGTIDDIEIAAVDAVAAELTKLIGADTLGIKKAIRNMYFVGKTRVPMNLESISASTKKTI